MERTAGGSRGSAALLVITLDKFKLLEDPDFTPGRSLNPVVSCGGVMKSDQASVFGFPHPMLGLVPSAVPSTQSIPVRGKRVEGVSRRIHLGAAAVARPDRRWDFWTS